MTMTNDNSYLTQVNSAIAKCVNFKEQSNDSADILRECRQKRSRHISIISEQQDAEKSASNKRSKMKRRVIFSDDTSDDIIVTRDNEDITVEQTDDVSDDIKVEEVSELHDDILVTPEIDEPADITVTASDSNDATITAEQSQNDDIIARATDHLMRSNGTIAYGLLLSVYDADEADRIYDELVANLPIESDCYSEYITKK